VGSKTVREKKEKPMVVRRSCRFTNPGCKWGRGTMPKSHSGGENRKLVLAKARKREVSVRETVFDSNFFDHRQQRNRTVPLWEGPETDEAAGCKRGL